MTEQKEISYPIYAYQEAKPMAKGYRYFHFYGQISPGKYDTLVKVVKDGEGYDSIEKLLSTEIKVHRKNSDLEKLILQMKGWVNVDFGKGFGTHYPEYKCVAWAGVHEIHKPIAGYTFQDTTKWIAHPQIQLMVQRYED